MSGSHYDPSPFDEPEYEEYEEERPHEEIPKQDSITAKLPNAPFKVKTLHLVIGGVVLFVLIVGVWLFVKGGNSDDGSDGSGNASSS